MAAIAAWAPISARTTFVRSSLALPASRFHAVPRAGYPSGLSVRSPIVLAASAGRGLLAGVQRVTAPALSPVRPFRASRFVVSAAAMSTLAGKPAAETIIVPAAAGKHSATVVWLHGLGDTGYGWSDVCEDINLPHIKWILPSAPIVPVSINGGMPCPSWFDLLGLDAGAAEDSKGIDAAARHVAAILAKEKRENPAIRFAIGGFSQGGALSLYLMARKAAGTFLDGSDASGLPLDASVSFSGWLPTCSLKPAGASTGVSADKAAQHPILMCHGEADMLVQYAFGKGSAQALQGAGFANLKFKGYRGMAHSASPQELADLRTWLLEHLGPS